MNQYQRASNTNSSVGLIVAIVAAVGLIVLLSCGGVTFFVVMSARESARQVREAELQALAAQQQAAEQMQRAAEQLEAAQQEQEAARKRAEQQQLEAAAKILGQTAGDMAKLHDELEKLGVDVGDSNKALQELQNALDDPEQADQLKALIEALQQKPAAPADDTRNDEN